jgi:hypothetical protein
VEGGGIAQSGSTYSLPESRAAEFARLEGTTMTHRAARRAVTITAAAAAVATGVLVAASGSSAHASEVPHADELAGPIVLPPSYFTSYTVTTTLVNRTGCTLIGSRGWPTAGALAPAPPKQIPPGGTGTWKASGSWLWEYTGASVTLTYALTGCSYSGEVGYTTRNDEDGLAYGDGSCDSGRPRGTKSTMTGIPGTNAIVSIDLGPAIIMLPPPHLPPHPVHPSLGACGDFPA